MELQAIIGVRKGRIKKDNVESVCSDVSNIDFTPWKALGTNIDTVKDFVLVTSALGFPDSIFQGKKVRNFYIEFSDVTDPQKFFRYLSNHEYVVRDSKLTQESHRKAPTKLPIPIDYNPHVSIRSITGEDLDKTEQSQGEQK